MAPQTVSKGERGLTLPGDFNLNRDNVIYFTVLLTVRITKLIGDDMPAEIKEAYYQACVDIFEALLF